jgi:hypothetical protein
MENDNPQNIYSFLEKIMEYGIIYPSEIEECNKNHIHKLCGNGHCSKDTLIYHIKKSHCADNAYLKIKYIGRMNFGIKIEEIITYSYGNRSSVSTYYYMSLVLKELEKYPELFALEIKEPQI